MMRILVTGGAGLVGSHLVERLLARGDEVVCLDNFSTGRRRNIQRLLENPRFELVCHDVNQPTIMEVDQVYHLACPGSPVHYQRHPVRTIQTAVTGTLHMLELAREVGARILIASTSEIYGDPEQHPQTEEYWGRVNPIGLRACYDEGKRCAEALTVAYAQQFGVQARIVRIFNTYGPRMDERDGRVVSRFVTQALQGKPLTIYGAGDQTRSFCYVSDLVEGLVRMMALPADPGPVNLGNPDERTVCQLAELVLELTGSTSRVVHEPLPADDPVRRCPNIQRAKKLLGWEPKVPLRQGLRATIDELRSRLEPPSARPDPAIWPLCAGPGALSPPGAARGN